MSNVEKNDRRWIIINSQYFESLSVASEVLDIPLGSIASTIRNSRKMLKSKGKIFTIDSVCSQIKKHRKIRINDTVYRNAESAETKLNIPFNTILIYIRRNGDKNKGSFTYKGKEYHFEFLN